MILRCLIFLDLSPTTEQNLLHCWLQQRRFLCSAGNHRSETPALWDMEEKLSNMQRLFPFVFCILQQRKTSFVVSHNERKSPPCGIQKKKKLLCSILQSKQCYCVVSCNGKKTKNLTLQWCIGDYSLIKFEELLRAWIFSNWCQISIKKIA